MRTVAQSLGERGPKGWILFQNGIVPLEGNIYC